MGWSKVFISAILCYQYKSKLKFVCKLKITALICYKATHYFGKTRTSPAGCPRLRTFLKKWAIKLLVQIDKINLKPHLCLFGLIRKYCFFIQFSPKDIIKEGIGYNLYKIVPEAGGGVASNVINAKVCVV